MPICQEQRGGFYERIKNVHWEGFINQSALPAYYRAADMPVLPTRREPWGLVVNEAMACGTPCIVSDVVGAGPDLVTSSNAGTVFRRDDAEDLAAAMKLACVRDNRLRWQANIPSALAKASFQENARVLREMVVKIIQTRGTRNSFNGGQV